MANTEQFSLQIFILHPIVVVVDTVKMYAIYYLVLFVALILTILTIGTDLTVCFLTETDYGLLKKVRHPVSSVTEMSLSTSTQRHWRGSVRQVRDQAGLPPD